MSNMNSIELSFVAIDRPSHIVRFDVDEEDCEDRIRINLSLKLDASESFSLEDGAELVGKTIHLDIIKTTNGEHFGHLRWRASDVHESITRGKVLYPEKFFLTLFLSDARYESILDSTRSNLSNPEIGIRVKGLEFGLSPDGDDLIWNNKSSPMLPITGIEFIWGDSKVLDLNAGAESDEKTGDIESKYAVGESMNAIYNSIKSIRSIGIVVAILIVLILIK